MRKSPFRYFKTSPEIIQIGVLMYVRPLLSLRKVGDLLLGGRQRKRGRGAGQLTYFLKRNDGAECLYHPANLLTL
jgi:hypothetical protein